MAMKINVNNGEVWKFVVFLYNRLEDIQQELNRKRRMLNSHTLRMEKEKTDLLSCIATINKEDGADELVVQQMQEAVKKIRRDMENIEENEENLSKLEKKIKKCYYSAIRNLSKYIRYIESISEEADYETYCNQKGREDKYTVMEYRGMTFYYKEEEFDVDYIDENGCSNLQRMEKGYAPIGCDGLYINLHHISQTEDGDIMELLNFFHNKNHKIIHINPNSIPSGIHRGAFNRLKKDYWKRRASFEIRRRGG